MKADPAGVRPLEVKLENQFTSRLSGIFGRIRLARVHPGDLDASFGSAGIVITAVGTSDSSAHGVRVQRDGKILVAGTATVGNDRAFVVVRYNQDGSLDGAFGTGGIVTTTFGIEDVLAFDLALQRGGQVVVVGGSGDSTNADFTLTRHHANGTVDTSFGGDGIVTTTFDSRLDIARAVAIQPDDKILVAGSGYGGGHYGLAIARYNQDGSLDAGFGSGGKVVTSFGTDHREDANDLALMPDGRIVVVGDSRAAAGTGQFSQTAAVARYNANGSLDTSFDSDGVRTISFGGDGDWGNAVTVQTDGKIVLGGCSRDGDDGVATLARFNTDGSLDGSFGLGGRATTSFGAGQIDAVKDLVIQPDGSIVAAIFSRFNASGYDFALARFNPDGSLDASFSDDGRVTTEIGPSEGEPNALALQSDGKIVVAGCSGLNIAVARYLGG